MSTPNKRKDAVEDNKIAKRPKMECPYGDKCFRLNPIHFKEYSHEHLESILDSYTGSGDFPIPSKLSAQKQMYVDQLKMIIHKQIYTPGKNFESEQGCSTSSATQEENSNPEQKILEDKNKEDKSKIQIKERDSSTSPMNRRGESSRSYKEDKSKIQIKERDSSTSPMNRRGESSRSSDKRVGDSRRGESERGESSRSSDNRGDSRTSDSRSGESNRASSSSGRQSKTDSDYRPIVQPTRRPEDFLSVVRPKGKMAAKHAASAPYHIFYTTITDSKETHTQPYSITFQEILDHSLGELKCSLQINFMVEIGWLLAQYYFAGYSEKKLTILYGEDCSDLKNINKKKPQVDAHYVTMTTPFGKHHTKMMILCYEDGSLRVVISTANLYLDDWENRTQGLWFSPSCPELPPDAMPHDGESPTMFKKCLLRYLNHYHLPQLAYYVERVKRCDFSHIKLKPQWIMFPNTETGRQTVASGYLTKFGLPDVLGAIDCTHVQLFPPPKPQQAQFRNRHGITSINVQLLWLTGDFLHNFTKIKNQSQLLSTPPELKIVYPSLENVRQSHDNLLGGGCLPYAADAHARQPWLNSYLYQWQAKHTARNKAMPHIKSYVRYNNSRAAYFLLTSANVSKAAWGQLNKGNGALRTMSYEAGVMFLPQFVIKEDFFPLQPNAKNRLIIPYDLPPIKYTPEMSVWVQDYLR